MFANDSQIILADAATGDFVLQPSLETVAAAAAAAADCMLMTLRRSLVLLAVPALNLYVPSPSSSQLP